MVTEIIQFKIKKTSPYFNKIREKIVLKNFWMDDQIGWLYISELQDRPVSKSTPSDWTRTLVTYKLEK